MPDYLKRGKPEADRAEDDAKVRATVESTELTLAGHKVRCTVSIGVASFPSDAQRPDELLELADQALYFAKNNGRNRVQAYRDIPPPTSQG